MEAEAAVAGDLLMECTEEEQDAFPASAEEHEAKEELHIIKVSWSPIRLRKEEEEDEISSSPVKIIPIPNYAVSSYSPPTPSKTAKVAGSALGFKVNGRPINLQPGGDSAKLKLRIHPGGSASGFTTIQIPTALTLNSHVGTNYGPTSMAPSGSESTPIITGVVSGEAAQKVLNDHILNFKASKPKKQRLKPHPCNKLTAPDKLLRKGVNKAIPPPNCSVCSSQYKLITELRGFMCTCSPAIALSLINLKKQKIKRRKRRRELLKLLKRSKGSPAVNKVPDIQPKPPAAKIISPPQKTRRYSDDFWSDELSSPASSSTDSPLKLEQLVLPSQLPQGKLVMLVEDFYYGSAPGSVTDNLESDKFNGPFRCIHCSKTLCNNIKLMDHMQQHVSSMPPQDEDTNPSSSCPHCFRRFSSSFRLQCHLDIVHSQHSSTVICKICELAFESQPAFLCHMKTTHKPGEMPYVCQVCDFHSSFYSDVWSHFKEAHADTRSLMCQYCLRILRSSFCYQQHIARHQKKHVHSCNKCRLHFLYLKEKLHHKEQHKTHIIPPQLSGLKPGTKVTVRTYSAGGPESEDGQKKTFTPCKVVEVTPLPLPVVDPQKKLFESLGSLLSGLCADSDFSPSQRCVECLTLVPDIKTHFPALIRCSICKFSTCCSNSYANHMINDHTTRNVSQFPAVFLSDSRLPQKLRCESCTFTTNRGDAMANHLTERPDHSCSILKDKDDVGVDQSASTLNSESNNSKETPSNENGVFVPILLDPLRLSSTQLSVKPLKPASSPPFTPAMTIKFLGPAQPKVSHLSLVHLSVVLSSLCHGIAVISRRCRMPSATIQNLISQQQRGLLLRNWFWKTDKMAEWVLDRREQQLTVGENVLLLTARASLGDTATAMECYSWSIDFMLRHDLGLQTTNDNRLKSIQDKSRTFIKSLYTQIQNRVVPLDFWGCMDELPVFINPQLFSKQDSEAFQLFGSPEEEPTFNIVISALWDGVFLPPMLFFTGAALDIPEGFPDNVLLEARKEGFSDDERLQIWIDKVWRPHVTLKHNHKSLLMVDVHRGHLNEKFRESLAATETDLTFIPPKCSSRLQPLEICVTQVLRDFLQVRWSQLVSDGGLDSLGLDQLALTLACWFSEVSSTLNSQTDFLNRSFSLVCCLKQLDYHGEAARMVTALTDTLIQTSDTTVPEPGPKQEPVTELMAQLKVFKEGIKNCNVDEERQKLIDLFNSESDKDSFHGFPDE